MTALTVQEAGEALGLEWFDHQVRCFTYWQGEAPGQDGKPLERMCVYYPTGKGKTKIALACMIIRGYRKALVIAPPSTEDTWRADADRLGIEIDVVSHAKYRERSYLIDRNVPVICDEFHLLGGRGKQGFTKFSKMSRGMKAPIIILSATPNYNDAERCYCIEFVLNPHMEQGGYIGWLYRNCRTQENPFARTPEVIGFLNHQDAEHYLSELPGVVYLPDDAPDILQPVVIQSPLPQEFVELGFDMARRKLLASQMEEWQRARYLQIVDPDTERVRGHVYDILADIAGASSTPILVFCYHSQIARALAMTMGDHGVRFGYVDGTVSKTRKLEIVSQFRRGELDALVGTSSIATGTDGIDKVCDTLVILDDTSDTSLRRQLVGRILPRGQLNPDYSNKVAYRFEYLG